MSQAISVQSWHVNERFEKTTNQKDGGAAFAEDVLKLELRMKSWKKHAGWEGVFEIVEYPR